jgi:hypothetical protein
MTGPYVTYVNLNSYVYLSYTQGHNMANDENSSKFLETQARDGSLKRFGKALANLYRDNKIIELDGGREASSRREWVRSGKFRMPKFRRVTSFDSSDGSEVKLEVQTKSRQMPTAKTVKDMQEIDASRRSKVRLDRAVLSKAVDSSVSIVEKRLIGKDLSTADKLSKTTDLERTRFVLSERENIGADNDGNPLISRRTSGAISYGREQINIKLATGDLANSATAAAAISQATSRTTWRDAVASSISKLSEPRSTSKLDERSRQRGARGL